MELVDGDFGRNGSVGWTGTVKISSCGAYGSVLGGLNVLGEHSSVSKTFTDLCPHGFVYVKIRLLLIDVAQTVTVRLYVNRKEVLSEKVREMAAWPSECGRSDGDGLIERSMRVYHTEDYVEARIQVDYDYKEVNTSSAKTFWGLKDFSLLLPCASSSSADCSMTTPLTQSCSDVTGSGETCVGSGDYLYVLTSYSLTWWEAESKCNEMRRGGHLAYFPDGQTYDEVMSALGSPSYSWIGLRSPPGQVNDFRWTAGGTPSFSRWRYGTPSGDMSLETFVYVYSEEWRSTTKSTDHNRVICSYPVVK
eukprot:521154-Hanusia_phi.AAC.2